MSAEESLVDGALLHPGLLPRILAVVDPSDITDPTCKLVFRALVTAHRADDIDVTELAGGYMAAGRQLEAGGRWSALVFRPGIGGAVLTEDPLAAAHVVAEASRRRRVAAELVLAADAVANGADPAAVLSRLEVAA